VYLIHRAHQTRPSGRNSRPISAKVTLLRIKSEIKVALFLFASHSFLANNFRFMVKLINKPFGVLCQFSGDEKNLSNFINEKGFYPAGRLDKKWFVKQDDRRMITHRFA
jgi:hypothetical protein